MATKTTKKKAAEPRSGPLTKDGLLGRLAFKRVEGLDDQWTEIIESTESADARAICVALMLLATEVHAIRWEGLPDQEP